MTKILSNQVHCDHCGDEPYSAHRHDFVRCQCGNIAVDGGMDYLRRVGGSAGFTDMSIIVSDQLYERLCESLKWAEDTKRNTLGTVCAVARALRDQGINIGEHDPHA